MQNTHYLDTQILEFSDDTSWTIRDACRGVQIFGSIGSGKSSGSGEFIARKYLQAGWGGLVLCAKPDEAGEWHRYARDCGREDDIMHFHEGSEFQFNPIQYETGRTSKGGGLTFNLSQLFLTVYKMGQRAVGGGENKEGEQFWENALKRLINRTIDLIKLSEMEMSFFNMASLLNTVPTSIDDANSFKRMSDEELLSAASNDFFTKCLFEAQKNIITPQQKRDLILVISYFLQDFPMLGDRIQGTVKEMFLGFAEPFLSGILNDHFSTGITISPEDSFAGKIILIDFSVMEYMVSGIYAQTIFKYLWQQSIQRRPISDNTPPVFLWIDESQYFINEYDVIFQTTARSSRACTVLLSQNISNYYMQMGGHTAKAKVDSMLGNLGTLIFHQNSDAETNQWASKLIGDAIDALEHKQTSSNLYSTLINKSKSRNEAYLPQVQPTTFTILKNGSPANNCIVEAIIFIGRAWADGKNHKKEFFKQSNK